MSKKKKQKKEKKEKVLQKSQKLQKAQQKVQQTNTVDKTTLYFLAKIDNKFEFSRADKFESHSEWLWFKYRMDEELIHNQILGFIKDKNIVLFTGRNRDKVARKEITFENIMELHNICRDNIGIGNYKIYNGITTDKNTGKYTCIGTLLDFDVRKPIKQEV